MKVIAALVLVLILGVASGLGYKFFLEERFTKSPAPEKEAGKTNEAPATSGFNIDANEKNKVASPGSSLVQKTPVVEITTRSDKKAIILTIRDIKEVRVIEYTITYISRGISKAVHGEIAPKSSDVFVSREILLGTCSGANCVYDEGVSKIDVAITFTLTSGQEAQIEKSHIL